MSATLGLENENISFNSSRMLDYMAVLMSET